MKNKRIISIFIILISVISYTFSVSGNSEFIKSEYMNKNKDSITGHVQLQNLVNQSIYLLVIGSNLQETYVQSIYLKGTGSDRDIGYIIPSNLPKTTDNKNATEIDMVLYLFVLNSTSYYNLQSVATGSVSLQNSNSIPGFDAVSLFVSFIVLSVLFFKKYRDKK